MSSDPCHGVPMHKSFFCWHAATHSWRGNRHWSGGFYMDLSWTQSPTMSSLAQSKSWQEGSQQSLYLSSSSSYKMKIG